MPGEFFSVTVYCGSCRVDAQYRNAARELGRAIGDRGWRLVYGGNDTGMMGDLADGCRDAGGHVTGISPALFGDVSDKRCDEFVVAEDMSHRKAELQRRADGFVALPGGIGTLEEFFETLVGRHIGVHGKPVILLNLDGFYTPLIDWLRNCTDAGFVRPKVWEQLHVVDTIADAIALLAEAAVGPARTPDSVPAGAG